MSKTILLADDSVTIQKVVELTFLDEDFRVVAVGDGAEAIRQLPDAAPDVVIADVHMPGADGYEVADAVQKNRPGTPVLLLVGTFEVFDPDRASAAGASGHLKKPFDSQELLRRVKDLLSGAAPAPADPMATVASTPALAQGAPEASAGPTFEPPPELDSPPAPEPAPVAAAAPPARAAAPAPPARAAAPPPPPPAAATGNGGGELSEAEVERIARRVAELIGDKVLKDVAWEVVPDLAEVLLKARIRELEASVE
jgi:CheY-like chemotaxis protein